MNRLMQTSPLLPFCSSTESDALMPMDDEHKDLAFWCVFLCPDNFPGLIFAMDPPHCHPCCEPGFQNYPYRLC